MNPMTGYRHAIAVYPLETGIAANVATTFSALCGADFCALAALIRDDGQLVC